MTVWVVVPVAGLLLESPLYVEVMGSLPTGRVEVVTVAVPVDGLTVAVPIVVPPVVTVTVPVVPGGSVVVMVTVSPELLGPEVVTVTVGVAFETTWLVVPVLALLLESPL